MMNHQTSRPARVFLDLTHVGRHVTGIERVAIEQFEKVAFEGAELQPVKARGIASMIFKQQIVLPLLALIHPRAVCVSGLSALAPLRFLPRPCHALRP